MNDLDLRWNRQQGLSIVELMVALLLGSILTLGLVEVFSANSQAFRFSDAVARSQEFGRIAAEMVTREARGAGYFGCNTESVKNNLDIEEGDANWERYNVEVDVGISSAATRRPTDALANTDFIFFSGLDGGGLEIAATAPPTAASTKVASRGGSWQEGFIEKGDVIAIVDCQGADIVQVSNVNGQDGDVEVTLVTNSGTGSPGNDFTDNVCSNTGTTGSGNNCLSNEYGPGAQILKPYERTYYIGTSLTTGEPALKMLTLVNGTEYTREMVEGVINMQVRYGLSSGKDKSVARWEDAETLGDDDWPNIRSVRVSLLVKAGRDELFDDKETLCYPAWADCSSSDNYVAPDNKMYRVYSFTTNVRNSSS